MFPIVLGLIFYYLACANHLEDVPDEIRDNGFLILLIVLGCSLVLVALGYGSYKLSTVLFKNRDKDSRETIMCWMFCGFSFLFFLFSIFTKVAM